MPHWTNLKHITGRLILYSNQRIMQFLIKVIEVVLVRGDLEHMYLKTTDTILSKLVKWIGIGLGYILEIILLLEETQVFMVIKYLHHQIF